MISKFAGSFNISCLTENCIAFGVLGADVVNNVCPTMLLKVLFLIAVGGGTEPGQPLALVLG